jgi:hypothetical protein
MLAATVSLLALNTQAQLVSDFESFMMGPASYLDGSGDAVDTKFASGNVEFPNVYQTAYGGYWSNGWAYSSVQNDTTAGFSNLYAAYANEGHLASNNYAVAQSGSFFRITGADKGKSVKGIYVTNGTFAAQSMLHGDDFAKKFGGVTGNDPDFFILTIKSYSNGTLGTDSVNFNLADFTSPDSTLDHIVKSWSWVDLSSLGNTDSLVFALSSSDNGQFGMNTPAFFCVDDIITDSDTADFENLTLTPGTFWNKKITSLYTLFTDGGADFPNKYNTSSYGDYWSSGFAISNMTDTVTSGYGNLFSGYAGIGVDSSENYLMAQKGAVIRIHDEANPSNHNFVKGMYVTNATYAALSMKNGDAFAKKFGGVSGNDEDWFKLSVVGYNNGAAKADTIQFYLADYRFADSSQDYIVKDWTWVNMSGLGECDSVQILLSSSDNSQWGMNTPAFLAIDNFTLDQNTDTKEVANAIQNSSMYPNPAKDLLTVLVDIPAAITIYDLNGRLVLSGNVSKGSQTLSVESMNTGMYIVKIESNRVVATKKLIIE